MAQSKITEREQVVSAGTVTEETPANADKTSNPVHNDAEANQPPVRTDRPDVPIADSLAAGAGAHEGRVLDHQVEGVPVDKDGVDRDGRFQGEPKKSSK